MISIKMPAEVQQDLAYQLRNYRKWRKHSRAELAQLSGVPEPTLRRFEVTGEISLRQFLMIAAVYSDLSIFDQLFKQPEARTMAELVKRGGAE